jgi:hypothetical protein
MQARREGYVTLYATPNPFLLNKITKCKLDLKAQPATTLLQLPVKRYVTMDSYIMLQLKILVRPRRGKRNHLLVIYLYNNYVLYMQLDPFAYELTSCINKSRK